MMLEHLLLKKKLEKIDTKLNSRRTGLEKDSFTRTRTFATIHDILHYIDPHRTAHAAVLDFTKAFDRVPHTLLMKRLSEIAGLY